MKSKKRDELRPAEEKAGAKRQKDKDRKAESRANETPEEAAARNLAGAQREAERRAKKSSSAVAITGAIDRSTLDVVASVSLAVLASMGAWVLEVAWASAAAFTAWALFLIAAVSRAWYDAGLPAEPYRAHFL